MQSSFHVSGFLYSLKTRQIFLIQSDESWSILEGEGRGGEETQAAFARIVNELLNLDLKAKNIHPIYDYIRDGLDKTNYVFYAEVRKTQNFEMLKEGTYCWVSFKETPKLLFTAHSKQDVIVGERVIRAKWRNDEARREELNLVV